jgi:hypothetical protein
VSESDSVPESLLLRHVRLFRFFDGSPVAAAFTALLACATATFWSIGVLGYGEVVETVRLRYVLNMLVIAYCATLKTTQTISYHSQKTSAILR